MEWIRRTFIRATLTLVYGALFAMSVSSASEESPSKVLSFTCYENATVLVDNPVPTVFRKATAGDDDGPCKVDFISDFRQLRISNCSQSRSMSLFLTVGVGTEPFLIGGKDSPASCFVLKCSNGGSWEVLKSDVPIYALPKMMRQVDPRDDHVIHKFSSAIRSYSPIGPVQKRGFVGQKEELYLTIDVPNPYFALPLNCTAYAGTCALRSVDTPSDQIIDNGCATEKGLVSDFHHNNSAQMAVTRRYWADYKPFKFFKSDHVCLRCLVRLCREERDCPYHCENHTGVGDVQGYVLGESAVSIWIGAPGRRHKQILSKPALHSTAFPLHQGPYWLLCVFTIVFVAC